jgi:hypothetical protein
VDEKTRFVLGNIILGVGLIMLLNINTLWDQMGAAAMGLWIAVVGLGAYLIAVKK